ncbi:MAG: hypothetical protein M3R04_02995 [bacterium]|nr:hypothetical protein [bacterium]
MRILLASVLICLSASSCSKVNYSTGFIRAIAIEPRDPVAGEKARVFFELHDPYTYFPDGYPEVSISVDGGELQGRSRTHAYGDSTWETISGGQIAVNPSLGTYWTLPTEPGTYKLTAIFDGDTRTLRVDLD